MRLRDGQRNKIRFLPLRNTAAMFYFFSFQSAGCLLVLSLEKMEEQPLFSDLAQMPGKQPVWWKQCETGNQETKPLVGILPHTSLGDQ